MPFAGDMSGTAGYGGSLLRKASVSKKIVHASEQKRPDVAAARLAWKEEQPTLEPKRLVFIDETGTSTAMARLRGRGKRGQRVIGRVPCGHWKTYDVRRRLTSRRDHRTVHRIDQAMTTVLFIAYLGQCLMPNLSAGDIVVMGNLPAHPKTRWCVRSSRRPAPNCATCRLILRTSIRSSRDSRNLKPTCVKPRNVSIDRALAAHRQIAQSLLPRGMCQFLC